MTILMCFDKTMLLTNNSVAEVTRTIMDSARHINYECYICNLIEAIIYKPKQILGL